MITKDKNQEDLKSLRVLTMLIAGISFLAVLAVSQGNLEQGRSCTDIKAILVPPWE